MFSGICPRGSKSAPGSGNTGTTSGRSDGPRYSALIGIQCPVSEIRELSQAPLDANIGNKGCLNLVPAPPSIEVLDPNSPRTSIDGGAGTRLRHPLFPMFA